MTDFSVKALELAADLTVHNNYDLGGQDYAEARARDIRRVFNILVRGTAEEHQAPEKKASGAVSL